MGRVCVIYDDRQRPDTTGGYCFRALRELTAAAHVRPDQLDGQTVRGFDSFVRVDDGLEYPLLPQCRPLVWWAIDTHLDPDRCLAQARAADVTFAAQQSGAVALQRAGVSAEWLPLACDPDVHRPHGMPKRYDVAFVGNLCPGPRAELLGRLRREYPNHFVGRAYFEAMARTYSEARAVFNRSVQDDLNMRVFEALACGSLLATNVLPPEAGQGDLFRDGVHLACYAGPDELFDKLRFYFARPDARERVERRGREEAVGSHTYRHRMERVLTALDRLPRRAAVPALPPDIAAPPRVDPGYFEFARPELLALVPADAREVVDVGCGAGRLGEALKQRQRCRVVGLEYDPAAAAAARTRLDAVIEGDVESLGDPFPPQSVDAVVCGDVLEHLRDPLPFLRRVRGWLRPTGVAVVSVPNVRHASVVADLLAGNWTYEAAGLLDRTHLRFFTRREVEKLLFRAGFAVPALTPVPGPGYSEWEAAGKPGLVAAGELRVGPLAPAEAMEFYTYQWLAAARPAGAPERGLTSIVILAHNQLSLTRRCIDSIRLLTDEPFELVLVDNGSSDGTPAFFRALAASDPRVTLVLNADNRGFPAGCNQGIATARGAQVLLLNNDTVVTTGWLARLLDALYSEDGVGLAGPCSNRVSGDQQVPVAYQEDDLSGLDGFAWVFGQARAGRVQQTDRLVGFCLLIRRSVIDAVGPLDEGFGIGNFEDDDYCRRAQLAGFKAVIARDAFVHHVGGATFRSLGVDYGALMRANQDRFRSKWETAPAPDALSALPRPPSDLRVLLLAHVGLFRDGANKRRFDRYRSLADRPGVTLFGPGVPGYQSGMGLIEVVNAACGGRWPDAVVHGCDPHASGVPLVADLSSSPVPTVLELGDPWARPDRQADFVRRHGFAACLIQESGHHLDYFRDQCPGVEVIWVPDAVDTSLFRDNGLPKDYDVVLYGTRDPEVCPLRSRLAGLLERQDEFRVLQIPRPETAPYERAIGAGCDGDLSHAINRAWVGVATQSIHRCLSPEHLEVAACGALVAGDLPDSARELFGADFLELKLSEDDSEILGRLRTTLADKTRLRDMATAASRRVVAHYSLDAFANRVLAALGGVVGRRGRAQCGAQPARFAADAGGGGRTGPSPSFSAGVDKIEPSFTLSAAPGGGLLLRPGPPLLSGCLIVRDNTRTIRACLESLRPWVDDLVVVDTGSRDDTPAVAAALGARVFHFPWVDDFAAARNESVRHARGEWVFWMDSDDTIDAVNGRGLRARAAGPHPEGTLGYVVRVHCPGPRGDDVTVVDHVKLFRNLPGLRFEHRIHEQILPAIRRAGGDVGWTDLFVVHSGYDHSRDGQASKRDRDLRILHLELGERPGHPFTLFNLGMTYADIGDPSRATGYLEESLRNSEPGESHRRKAYALLAHCRSQLGDLTGALRTCEAGLDECTGDTELRFRQGVIFHGLGRLADAAGAYESVLTGSGCRYFTSIDRGIQGAKARQNLAVVLGELGEWDRAEAQWRAATVEDPGYRPGWRGLGETLIRVGKFEEAARLVEAMRTDVRLAGESFVLAGRVADARGRPGDALAAWASAAAADPADPEPLRLLGRLHFERGDDAAAERTLRALTQADEGDASAHHNLGVVLLRMGQASDAACSFRRSLDLRPHSPDTRVALAHALQQVGGGEA